MTAIPIFHEHRPVGSIDTTQNGLSFSYADAWRAAPDAFPISLSMPLAASGWDPDAAALWLMNLLPEGEPLRAMTRVLGVAREDLLGLIAETGRDVAGALTIGRPRPDETARTIAIGGAIQLERIIEELPSKPFLVGEDGVSMSLAGVQEKLPIVVTGDGFAIPINGAASTHILKPNNPRLSGSVQNEALCMSLARRCGLSTADVTTGTAGARSYLLVTRYDRFQDGPEVRRVHQEDFCQALSTPPALKYEHNGSGRHGPSLADMFALVRRHMTARDTNRLLDAVIFNIAVGNVDSHAKNYSVLLRPGRVELAPLYDLMSGMVWSGITENHAQEVGGQRRGRHINARNWRRMAEAAGLSATAAVRRVGAVAARVLAELPAARQHVAAMPAGEGGFALGAFGDAIAERARLVMNNATHEGDDVDDGAPDPDGAKRFDA